MYPKLFEIGPIPVYSYGLMLGIAFLIGSTLFSKELKRLRIEENVGIVITFIAIICGIVGSKIFYIIEEWNFGKGNSLGYYLTADNLFSPAGLTFYGGVVLSIIVIYFYCRKKKVSIMLILDAMAPGAAIAYAIARIGCHLSGDGCYGANVNGTFWEFLGYSYSKGIVATKVGELVHPTPLYELAFGVIVFVILWGLRKKVKYFGQLFYIYLILTGIPRLLVEFIRLNPKVIFGLTQAQLISIAMILFGVIMLIINRNKEKN
ncbi:MAG: prolipoprotein diacylglyceryl transferase family protein [Ignavibacteria bacterium]|jgi:phosphatidylglycerol:prolipoprotein diacylglycerol transferase